MLKGHVGRYDKMLICGWALDTEQPEKRPEVVLVQEEQEVLTISPRFPAPHLRGALGLPASPAPPIYSWRISFPLTVGVKPDLPFDLRMRETGQPLQNGSARSIPLCQTDDAETMREISEATLVFPNYSMKEDRLDLAFRISAPVHTNRLGFEVGGDVEDLSGRDWGREAAFLGKPTLTVRRSLEGKQVSDHGPAGLSVRAVRQGAREPDPHQTFCESLRTLWIPPSLFDDSLLCSPVPDTANIRRVSGRYASRTDYLVGGRTTYRQLNALARRYFDRDLRDFDSIVDWGVGCGRVLRHFVEDPDHGTTAHEKKPRIHGYDIDEVNIAWCREHMGHMADVRLLALDGFPLPDASVDLLYGISVMTHLSERDQLLWLDEIRRVLRPGGGAILTVHGEVSNYHRAESVSLPFFERFGFFDALPDDAIGTDRDTYYRVVFHARQYVKRVWSRYLRVMGVVPAANSFMQDFVVLRKEPSPAP